MDGSIDDIDEFIMGLKEINNGLPEFFFLLDTNFVIMIREYQRNPKNFKNLYGKQAQEFHTAILKINKYANQVIYQYGLEESCRAHDNGNIDLLKYKSSFKYLKNIFGNGTEVNTDFISEIDEDIAETKIPLLKNKSQFGDVLIINYIFILKAFLLKKYSGLVDKLELSKEFIDYCKSINIISPVTATCAIHYFGTKPNILKNIKAKDGFNKILVKAYGAAIDLSYPTISMQLSEITGFRKVPIIVTFDEGLKRIIDSLVVIDTSGRVPAYNIKVYYDSEWKDNEIIEVVSYMKNSQESSRNNIKPNRERLFEIISNLESELKRKL